MTVRSSLRAGGLTTAFAVAAVCAQGAIDAAAAQTVRLEDVITGTLSHSVLVDRESEKVRKAAGQLREAQGAFDWTINAESGWERLYVPKVRDGVLTSQIDTPDAIRTTLGIGRTFRNGISVAPGVSFYAHTDATAAQTAGLTTPRPALNLTIPLFRGRGEDNLLATNERAAAATVEGSNYSREFAVQKSVHDAVQVYWRCLAARQHVALLDADQHAADDYASSLRMLVQRGQIEPTLLDRALAAQAVQRVALSRALSADQLCRRDLGVAMGGTPGSSLPTAIGDFPAMDGMTGAVEGLNEMTLAEMALINRRDMMALVRYDAAEQEHVRGARNGLPPKIDIYLDPTRVLLRYTRSIGRDTEQGQVAAAVAGEGEARLNLEQAQNQVRNDIADQVRNLKEALADWSALMQSVALLENVVSDAKLRAEAGVITQQEYRVTQNELTTFRGQVIDAKLQYAASLAGLRLATGTIEAGDGIPVAGTAGGFRSLPER